MASARVLDENEVIKLLKGDTREAQNIIGLPVTTLQVLLDTFRWDAQALMDSYFTNDEHTFEKAKCIDPESFIADLSEAPDACGICFDDLEKKGLTHATCGHVFCFSCWKDFLKQSIIEEGKSLRLECPMSNCSALLEDNFIVDICNEMDSSVLERYWSLLAKAYVEKKEALSKCPAADCKNTVMLVM
jgi:ariadne-1